MSSDPRRKEYVPGTQPFRKLKEADGVADFLEEISSLSYSIIFLYFFALKTVSYLFLLFFGTLHSDVYIFPLLLCFSLLLFSHVSDSVRPHRR